jgi:acetoin utilization deacetylase AcuC-like enzyme
MRFKVLEFVGKAILLTDKQSFYGCVQFIQKSCLMLKVAWSPRFNHPLPEGHRFPMEKYDLVPEQLIREGTLQEFQFFNPPALKEPVFKVHKREYIEQLINQTLPPKEVRRTGFPLSEALVEREFHIMDGSCQAGLFALEYGVACNMAGGTHHAFADHGEGFCLFNDAVVCIQFLLDKGLISKALVVDLDVHQGNGTAHMLAGQSAVFTLSMHGKNNFPAKKEVSSLDIPLEDQTDDATYLSILQEVLPRVLDEVQPDFVFFNSGVDVLESDKIGKLSLSIQGCKDRDRLVFEHCKTNKIPVVAAMGGSYSWKLADIIEAHANTFRTIQDIYF